MVSAQDGPLMSSQAALRPAGGGLINARALTGVLFVLLAISAIAAAVVAAFLGETTVALVIAILTGAVIAGLIV